MDKLSAGPQTSMAKLQAAEVSNLFDFEANIATVRGYTWQPMKAMNWQGTGWKGPAGSVPPGTSVDDMGLVGRAMNYAQDIEEVYADIMSVRNLLGREMTAQDIIDVASGADSFGAWAINKNERFSDFLSIRDPESTAAIFNRIAQALITAGGAAAAEELKENKSLFIIEGEFKKLLKEIYLK